MAAFRPKEKRGDAEISHSSYTCVQKKISITVHAEGMNAHPLNFSAHREEEKKKIFGQPISTKTIHYVDKWKKAPNYCSCRFILSALGLAKKQRKRARRVLNAIWKGRQRGGGISLLECHWGELEQFALNGFEFGIGEGPAAIYHVQPTTLLLFSLA
ncbi:hypothetical protein HNY73_016856 [Argiope bruennichi]|uniref:Uncharacterized protein n=1 Tax=Argiope bruennichi TaxID=94029 RepID=A0A8T0EL35_ARGBR|nr:hypothetical protein HNY73_016856 [Argiope bruennichi]